MLNQVLATLDANEFTVAELNQIQAKAEELVKTSEARYARTFGLGDRVRLEGSKEVVTVVRRNTAGPTVSIARKDGTTEKVTPSRIVEMVEAGDPGTFDYFDYFGK